MIALSFYRRTVQALLLAGALACSSCYSYRVATHAQPATDAVQISHAKAYSLFWGLINKPQVIHTPNCDALKINGVSEVSVKTNFGNTLLTVVTLGIYCPVRVEWKCSKPCAQSGAL